MSQKKFTPVLESGNQHFVFREAGTRLVFFHNISGDLTFSIESPGVTLHIFGLYTGHNADRFQVTTLQLHNAPSSSSNLYIKGTFEDKSQFIYKGLIRIEKNGSGSHAYQKNQNLILSDDVFVSSKPDLEILAKDVFCTHGSTTGRPNKQQQYYMQTRGIDEKDGRELTISGFIAHLFSQMEHLGFTDEAIRYKKLLLPKYA